ncbi:flavocytochrome c [Vibrio rarus]|uniref:flavocytochrome c n=1 Tax=Vibrio rarus TaxID=413403 RepID=UPI0021C40C28|nr:flavocytochrome c [Vibrio rarus]
MTKLAKAIALGSTHTKLKSRIVMAPMTIQSAFFDGGVTQEMIDYYAARSGEAGAVIVESAFVENYGRAFPGALGINSDKHIAGLTKLATAIKEKGSKAILQIYHAGRMANGEFNGGHQPISASAVAALRDNAETPLAMSEEQIEAMIDNFAQAVNRAIVAGFDGVEIHGANTYLIQQFFSPHSNRRTDKWGGDREKRSAFPLAVLEQAKAVVASHQLSDFIIGYRFSPEEIEQPGIRFEDSMFLLDKLAKCGLDYFHFSMGNYMRNSIVNPEDTTPLIHQYHALKSENVAKIPVIGVGGIAQHSDALDALTQGYDMVSVGKGFLVDPQWAQKALAAETCAEVADLGQQQQLVIPAPLWDIMDYMIVDGAAEALKQQRIKELQNFEITFEPGEYTAYGYGHNGQLPVTVTFSNDEILQVQVDSSKESDGIANPAFERIPQQILENQTLNIDVISGATVSSQAVIDGVSNAVDLAGGNSEALRNKARKEVQRSTQTIQENVDVVVVGGGGAGLSAALTALDNGKSVVILEKFPAIGGNTVRTGGWVNAAEANWQKAFPAIAGEVDYLKAIAATPESDIAPEYLSDFRVLKDQLENYFLDVDSGKNYLFDSTELHLIQTYLGGKRTNRDGTPIFGQYDLVNTLTSRAMESIDWLTQKGIDFNRNMVDIAVGALWRRAHKPNRPKGVEFVEKLQKQIIAQGGRIITDTRAEELIVEKGKVTGVKATHANGTKYQLTTNNGVVLASGGFGANTKMLQKYNNYWTEIADDIKTTNSPALIGDGIDIGEKAGANLVGMEYIQLMPIGDPKSGALLTGLIVPPENFVFVNQQGKRFVDECQSRDVLSNAFFDNGGVVYMIADEAIRNTAANTTPETIEREIAEGIIIKADTIAQLAKKINVPVAELSQTIERYNSYVDEGRDPEFHKGALGLKVEQGPFYATPRKPSVHHTMGGLQINTKACVLNKDGVQIPGLYAAGEVTGGIHAGNRLGGNALIDIFTYGRIAGDSVSTNA